jgi:hypothetical protein
MVKAVDDEALLSTVRRLVFVFIAYPFKVEFDFLGVFFL